MKKFRPIVAIASMVMLFLCGYQVNAQTEFSGAADIDLKQLIQMEDVTLVDATEATQLLTQESKTLSTASPASDQEEITNAITAEYYANLVSTIGTSNESLSKIVENSTADLVRIAFRFKNDGVSLNDIYNSTVNLLEN